ncbi:MAG: glutamate--cysteine ligase [Pseudomonadota bacterium]
MQRHDTTAQRIAQSPALLAGIVRGIEKESLRIDAQGVLAQTPHPPALGSALTHERITTDFSESLVEFITPVSESISETLQMLHDVHVFTYQNLKDEQLWCASMPCIVTGDSSIPVARYGSSNVGRMKTVYRLGLGNRYGRMMQAIAGVHYNFSLPEKLWIALRENDSRQDNSLTDYKTRRYLDLIRNFHHWSWLLIYLFGASPAICESFLGGRSDHELDSFPGDCGTLYLPHATALRMGDLGYNSSSQKSLRVCYNSLENYLTTLTDAILTPDSQYADFRGLRDGEYMQLNDGLLQIENEFYSTIRPKRSASSGETPLTALHERGVEYIEVRCNDVSPFHPMGIDETQIRFLDSFLLNCLMRPSPECNENVQNRQAANIKLIVTEGRKPGLKLETKDGARPAVEWAANLLTEISEAASLLDAAQNSKLHGLAVDEQMAKVTGDEELPSARVLREMHEQGVSYSRLMRTYSQHWAEYFRGQTLSSEQQNYFETESAASVRRQHALEASQTLSFDEYLAGYYQQYQALAPGLANAS